MISKKHRLTTQRFDAVFANGVVFRSKHFLMRALVGSPTPAFAVVVGKKITKTAVRRNTLRRKVFRCLLKCLQEKKELRGEYIFFLRTDNIPTEELCDEIHRALTS